MNARICIDVHFIVFANHNSECEERSCCCQSESQKWMCCRFFVSLFFCVCLFCHVEANRLISPPGWCGFWSAVWLRWLKAQLTLLLVVNVQQGGSLCASQDCWGTSTLSSTWMQTINLKFNGSFHRTFYSRKMWCWFSFDNLVVKRDISTVYYMLLCSWGVSRLQGPHCCSSTVQYR